MKPQRKRKLYLIIGMVLAVGIAVGLVMYALTNNIDLFYSPTQIANGEAKPGEYIRAGGMVVDGSVKRDPESLKVEFALTDFAEKVVVNYEGILPDLFREGQGIVAMGKMDTAGVFQASEVLAKHDEEYMPPEVAEALKKSGAKMPDGSKY